MTTCTSRLRLGTALAALATSGVKNALTIQP